MGLLQRGCLCVLSLLAVSVRVDAGAPAIQHKAVGCIVDGSHPRLESRFDPADQVSRGRVRFRPSGGRHWYSVGMAREGEIFVGVLPTPTRKLRRIDYYVDVTALDFSSGRTPEYSPEVVAGPGACQAGQVTAISMPAAEVILEVPPGAPPVPAGFSSTGVAMAGTPTTAVAGAAGGGMPTTTVVGIAAATVAGGVAIVSRSREEDVDPRSVSGVWEVASSRNGSDSWMLAQQGTAVIANPSGNNPAFLNLNCTGTFRQLQLVMDCQRRDFTCVAGSPRNVGEPGGFTLELIADPAVSALAGKDTGRCTGDSGSFQMTRR